jgi:hypothetical protein
MRYFTIANLNNFLSSLRNLKSIELLGNLFLSEFF